MANPNIFNMMGDTVSSFSDHNNWRKFLECSGWNFKYTWPQQVLIYAQRPDSRACANQEVWARLGRYVKKNARIISILDETTNSRFSISHIIDVSDTESPTGKSLDLWSFNSENSSYVFNTLSDKFGIPLSDFARSEAQQLAHIITEYVKGYETDIDKDLQQFLINSVICQVFSRCELSVHFNKNSLAYGIENAPDIEVITTIGNYVQEISKKVLLEINQGVKEFNKNKLLNFNKEVVNNEKQQNSLSDQRRLSDSEHRSSTDRTGQIRKDEKDISEGRETGSLFTDDDRRQSDGPSSEDRTTDQEGNRVSNERADEDRSTSTEQEQSGMGEIHGTDKENSRGNGSAEDSIRIEHNFDLGAGYLGNGLTVWDRNQRNNQDYMMVAHISTEGEITFYDEKLYDNEEALKQIKDWAKEEKIKNHPELAQQEEETIFPSEEEQIETAIEAEVNNSSEFLNREPLSHDIDINEAEVTSEIVDDNTELPAIGEVVTLYGSDYIVRAVTDKTVTLQDVAVSLFTQDMDIDVFRIILNNSISIPEKTETREESQAAPEQENVAETSLQNSSREDYLKEDSTSSKPIISVPEATQVKTKRTRKTYAQLHYDFMEQYVPEFMNKNLDYIRLESEGYEPLYVDRIAPNQFAIAHTYTEYGDLMYDPEMVFIVDDEKREIRPFSFKQSMPPVYNLVYDYNDTELKYPNVKLEKELQSFFKHWKNNLAVQGHVPVKAKKRDNELGDIEYRYENGKFIPVEGINTRNQNTSESISNFEKTETVDDLLNEDRRKIYDFIKKNATEIINEDLEIIQLTSNDGAKVSIEDIGDNHVSIYYTEPDKSGVSSTYEFDFILDRETESIRFFMDTNGVMNAPSWFNEIIRMELTKDNVKTNEITAQSATAEPIVEVQGEMYGSIFDFINEQEEDAVEIPQPVQVVPEAVTSERHNYINPYLENGVEENYGPPRARYANNIAAIKLLKSLEEGNRLATPEEQVVLSKYVGWGGLADAFDESKWPKEYEELKELLNKKEYESARESTLTAFYTPPVVLESIYDTLRNFGFENGNILEPACGTGNFFGMLPEDMRESKMYGVELDSISGRIAQYLYPESNIAIEGFEETNLPDNFFDVTISNVPFGDFGVYDPKYNHYGFRIHDYFFAKGLDKLRPGGVMAYITSSGTMDKTNSNVRKYISQKADLLGAIRLPNNTFKTNAGTEVTSDILFLKKRDTPKTEEPDWIYTESYEDTGLSINSYFIEHPEMVMGDIEMVSGPHGPQLTCSPKENISLKEQLHEAIQNITGEYSSSIDSLDLDESEHAESIPALPDVRNFSYTLVDDTVYFRENSIMNRVNTNATAEKRIKGMIEVRDILRTLIDAQVEGASDEKIFYLQNKLNESYDRFTKQFGLINNRGNDIAFSDDSSYYLLCSLEKIDNEGNFIGKADIFSKRTIAPPHSVESVDTPEEALLVSMGERARVDISFMATLCNKTEEEVIDALKGKIYLVPGTEDTYEPSNIYLSGNILNKLNTAKAYAENNPALLANVEALEKVMPEPLGPGDIEVSFGSTWIPVDIYREFIIELMEYPEHSWRRNENNEIIAYNAVADEFTLKDKDSDWSIANRSTYGTSRMKALQIIEHSLNGREIKIFDTVHDSLTGKDKRVLNGPATFEAREKQADILEKFHSWLWSDVDRSDRLCKIYNEKFNCIVPPHFDGDTVIFHGMNPDIQLRDYQKNAVARILQGGNTALAHEVGAGKTFTMIAGAMESKHLGLCNKSIITVPNHLVGQWAAAIYQLYPTANVLAATKKDFEKANRKKFCSRIATGDYDIVVLGHTQFERIPISKERQEDLLNDQIDSIIWAINEEKSANGEYALSIKSLERTKKGLETRLKKLQETSKRDDVVYFEELGVDKLFVDESHNFKNLFLFTKKSNVAGIGQTDSQRASDMFMKCRYLDEITGNKGTVFATGTLISNTIAEAYTVQRYLQYDVLKDMGLDTFDKWSSTYAQATSSLELAPEGSGFRERTRFSKFFNLPELMNMFKMNVDIQTGEMLNLPVPEVNYETVVLEPSEEQTMYVEDLARRAERIRNGGVNPSEDNMLKITNDGRKLALDQRLIDPDFPDNPHSKSAACADKIYELWLEGSEDKLTQTVFCDLSTPTNKGFNVYQDLKEKLIAKGIPEEEIKFVHEAKTDVQKEDLFAKVRSGDVRVLMGSTGKMGTGTNVQDRLIAGHDLDCPWRPSDLEQRKGRVVRFGNQNDLVHMYRYVTEGTFDAYMYQLIENKQRMISQILTGKNPLRSANDVDDMTLNYAEIKGLATGNPMIMEKVGLEIDIQRLEMVRTRFLNQQQSLKWNVQHRWPEKLEEAKARLTGLEKDLETYKNNPVPEKQRPDIIINGETFETDELAGRAILSELATLMPSQTKTIGTIQDFDIVVRAPEKNILFVEPELILKGSRGYSVEFTKTGHSTVNRMVNVLNSIAERHTKCEKEIGEYTEWIADGLKEMEKPFAKEEELKEKKARLSEIDAILTIDEHKNKEEDFEITEEHSSATKEYSSFESMISSASSRSGSFGNNNSEHSIDNERWK